MPETDPHFDSPSGLSRSTTKVRTAEWFTTFDDIDRQNPALHSELISLCYSIKIKPTNKALILDISNNPKAVKFPSTISAGKMSSGPFLPTWLRLVSLKFLEKIDLFHNKI